MKAVYTSVAALALSVFAAQANASIVLASNDFQNPNAPGWTYAKNASKIVDDKNNAGNKVLQFTGSGVAGAVTKTFESQSGDLFVSFDFSYTGMMSTNTFLGVSFGSLNTSPSIGIKSNCDDKSGVCTNDVFVRMNGTDTQMMPNSNLMADTTYTIFGRLFKDNNSDTYNRFDAWLNPTAADLQSLTGWGVSATGTTSIKSADILSVRSAFLDSNSVLTIDNLQASRVPEPGTMSLIGLALAGVALSRRKRA